MAQRAIKRAARCHAGRGAANDGWNGLVDDLRPIVSDAGLAMCNLETPILPVEAGADAGKGVDPADGTEFPKFFGPTALVGALRDAGFDLVGVANNHAHDMGAGGMDGTNDALTAAGLLAAGQVLDGAAHPPNVPLGHWTLRALGATTKMNKTLPRGFTRWDVQSIDPASGGPLIQQVEAAAAAGQASVVSLHWGAEWGTAPDEVQRALAQRLCEAGAVLVLGHHSHVAQSVEVYKAKDGRVCLIAWSLGNLVAFEPDHPEANLGMVLRAELDSDSQGRPRVVAATWQPTWAWRDGDCIRIVPLDSGTDAARRALADPACQRELKAAEQRIGPRTITVPTD